MDINIDPIVVRRTAKNLKKYSEDLKRSRQELDGVISSIEDAWKSRNTSAYIDCLEDTGRELMKAADSVERISGNLYRIADTVERTERELQLKMNRCGGGSGGGGGGAY